MNPTPKGNKAENLAQLAPGDIVYSTYGYDSTPVQFAVITHTTENSIWYQEINRTSYTGQYGNYTALPDPHHYNRLMTALKTNPDSVKKQSHRKNIYRIGVLTRKKTPHNGFAAKDGAFYVPWRGEPIEGNR